ncbi:hypothetical protein Q9L58_009881 [Maublancomyces gigas]|uniref:DUF3824 domain-containing protein n=1 Tax=Discina gigas TaxID=1032678 RepID=A0ABR3G5M7_9PEZI
MSVFIEDDMILPSMRGKRYHGAGGAGSIIGSSGSTTTIEIFPRAPMREPIVIHEDHYVPVYGEGITQEYIVAPSQRRRERELEFAGNTGLSGAHYVRARSVGAGGDYDSYDSYTEEEYFLEDGSRQGGAWRRHRSPGRHSHGHSHGQTRYLEGAQPHRSKSSHRVSEGGSEHSHRVRHLAESGIAAAGLRHAANAHRQRSHSRGRRGSEGAISSPAARYHEYQDEHDRRHALNLAEAGLGIAAAGAAKELYDHRKRAMRRRSSSLDAADMRQHESHTGRNVAAAALGATATGLAYQKMQQRHARRRSSSLSSHESGDEGQPRHRGRKVAGAAIGAAAAGMAGKAVYDRYYRSHSRSSSSSSSDSEGGRRRKYTVPAAALGTAAAAAALGVKHHRKHRHDASHSRSRSRSRSNERHHSNMPAAFGTAAALGTATALGVKHHRKHKHDGSRSRSRSRSNERHHGPGAAVYTMAGGLAEKHHHKKHHERRRSLSEVGEQERSHRRMSESGEDKHRRSRRGSTAGGLGRYVSNIVGGSGGGMGGNANEGQQQHRGLGEKVAYKLGEMAAAEITRRGTGGMGGGRR